ncbi:ribbon-helix-helix domain-containing protein [Dongia mobilis]|jgi:predicted DNA-binding ribbon-helix-helix protein|uniref:ribbon-helix-helix domain-containing protein n=1 Tax=Dongia sp. TaxID=1977262 RepID=UPI0026EC126F
MCQVFASQDPDIYSSVTRSVRLDGFSTSIRLEALFWSILEQIAEQEGMSTPRFISTLYGEVLERRGEVGNFTSLLRVTCAVHIERQQGHQPVAQAKQNLGIGTTDMATAGANHLPAEKELRAVAS